MCSRHSTSWITLTLAITLLGSALLGRIAGAQAADPAACVTGAWSDPTYRPAAKPPGRNQAIWMRGISTNLVFSPDPGQWVESGDGTAQLTGTVRSLTNSSSGFV